MQKLRGYEIALGLLLATVFWAGVFLWQSQQPVPHNQRQPAVAERQDGPPRQAVANPGAHKQPSKGQQEGKWYDTFANHAPDWFVAIFTGLLAFVTYRLVKTTGDLRTSTDKLWAAGERQIEVARKSAEAAQQSAETADRMVDQMEETSVRQLRAYLSVIIGAGIYQDRKEGLKFEVRPTLINTGDTPAYRVTYSAKADILPFPLPDDFVLPPTEDTLRSAAVLGPHQTFLINAVLDRFVDDGQAEVIKRGTGSERLYIWGTVTYEDTFRARRFTNFCHCIYWVPLPAGETVFGLYANRHNNAD